MNNLININYQINSKTNSSQVLSYKFIDFLPNPGNNEYRNIEREFVPKCLFYDLYFSNYKPIKYKDSNDKVI